MTAGRREDWRRVREVLEAALALPPELRLPFVAERCHGEPGIEAQVVGLLASHDGAADFLETPAARLLLGDPAPTDLTGLHIGPYHLEDRIGSGGMGEVYRALDTRLQRIVAIKVLPSAVAAHQPARERFEREARAVAALNHPHICTLHDVGTHEGVAYLVMEFLEGETLAKRLERGALAIDQALQVAIAMCAALDRAHRSGIVHRDLKPRNIMLTPSGAKLLDFGVAKTTAPAMVSGDGEASADHTAPGTILGTLQYMAPEQLEGRTADARTDVFALGCVLYEMVTAKKAFDARSSASLLTAIMMLPPTPIRKLRPGVPAGVEQIITRCLEKQPEARWQTASDLLTALNRAATPKAPHWHRTAVLAAAALVALLAAGAMFSTARPLQRAWDRTRGFVGVVSSPADPSRTAPTSLAVLPFNQLEPLEGDRIGIGIADTLITRLSRLRSVAVRPTAAVLPFAGRPIEPADAGRTLDVDFVLDGTVRRAGDRLRVTVQLVAVGTRTSLWAQSFDEHSTNLFDVEDSIAERVAQLLLKQLPTADRAVLLRRHTNELEAYRSYAAGRYLWNRRTDTELRRSIQYFSAAIEKDPAYALAHAGLADAYLTLGNRGFITPAEAYPRAKSSAAQALALDEDLAEPRIVLAYAAFLYDWKADVAEREFARGLDRNPNYASGHQWRAIYEMALGRTDRAFAEIERAQQLDPTSLIIDSTTCWLHYLQHDYDRAVERCRQTLDLDPQYRSAHYYLGLAYLKKSRFTDAVAEFELARDLDSRGGAMPDAGLVQALAGAGRINEARTLLRSLDELAGRQYVSPYVRAVALAGLGDRDAAFVALDAAYQERHPWLVLLAIEPLLDPLRVDPRFAQLMDRVGLWTTGRQP